MKDILAKLLEAGRTRIAARFTLWHVSATGEYRRLLATDSPEDCASRFVAEAIHPDTVGLEVRCDGVRVDC